MKNSKQRGGFALGLIVGLLLGLALALGVALYITKVPIPFVNKVPQRTAEQDAAEAAKNKNWDPNAPLAGKNPARPASVPAAGASGAVAEAASAAARPAAASAVATAPALPPVAAAASAASAPRSARDPAAILAGQSGALQPKSTAPGAEAFSFYVQAGAYARTEDAEAQRAKLAMLGVAAKVMEREQSGRMVYRVRIGPFDAREEAEAMQSRLAGSSVESNLVRVER
ncbi:SPOR domain-containing protein [Aquabacterium sp.]|uniref:SPOR domain-containing protein n=1 Tax=Aquabacterium sp. TaxID=1872578 RepID=UPI00378322F5